MNTIPRSNLPLYVLLGLVVLSTLVLAISLAGLPAGSNGPAYSAPVLFNQANAAFQQGKVGEAIANYERARLLAPADPDIAANLNWAREHSGLTTPTASWLDRATSWASPNTMALLGWLGLVLTGAGLISALSFSQRRDTVYFTSSIGIILLTLSALSAITAWQKCHEAVVIAPDTTARISPVTNGEISFKLRPGETVSIAGRYHDFTLVQNSTGHSGWVAQNDITPLVPSS
jgi:hypothetical protein